MHLQIQHLAIGSLSELTDLGGADILRVHNVKGVDSACKVFKACLGTGSY